MEHVSEAVNALWSCVYRFSGGPCWPLSTLFRDSGVTFPRRAARLGRRAHRDLLPFLLVPCRIDLLGPYDAFLLRCEIEDLHDELQRRSRGRALRVSEPKA